MFDVKQGCTSPGMIDRGVIGAKNSNKYNVVSLDRPNIVIMNITAINSQSYNVGDNVIFISFPDGTGKIICKL